MTEGVLIHKNKIDSKLEAVIKPGSFTGKSAGEMEEVMLIPKRKIDIKVEADVITPDAFAGKNAEEIGNLSVWQGPKTYPLSEFFEVKGNGGSSAAETLIRIKGDSTRVKRIGEDMSAGKIEIEGSAGMHVGTEMKGGEILVFGDVDSWAGMEMAGGLLHIKGNAGDHVGCAYRGKWHGMKGGRIVIEGSTRHQLGGGMDGGEILVEGNVEGFCGIRQNGGLIVVKGRLAKGGDKFTDEYTMECASCWISPVDFASLCSPDKVKVTSRNGKHSIAVYTKCTNSVCPGHVFMPRAIWSNVVIDPDTLSTGSPLYKGAPVKVEPTEEEVLSAEDVVLKVYVGGQ